MALSHGNYRISTQNLALYYDPFSPVGKGFDDSVRTTVLDLSGNGRHATRAAGFVGTTTQPLNYFTFAPAGSNKLQTQYNYQNITALSYECWIRTSSTRHTSVLFNNRGTVLGQTTGKSVTMGITPLLNTSGTYGTTQAGRVIMGIDSDSLVALRYTDIAVNDGIWHHVVGVFERASGTITNSDFQVYIDGVARTMTNGASNVGSQSVPISGLGGMSIGFSYEWNRSYPGFGLYEGDMGATRIYERALSAVEIQATYNLERSKYGR